jgi:hypothetical protein
LKAVREKFQFTYKGKLIRITDFATETVKARRSWDDVFQALKDNNCQPRLLYPAKLSFRIKEEIKTFKDKHKLKQFMTTKVSYTEKRKINTTIGAQKRINSMRRIDKQVKIRKVLNILKNKKMTGISTYSSIITPNVNGLNSIIKTYRLAD